MQAWVGSYVAYQSQPHLLISVIGKLVKGTEGVVGYCLHCVTMAELGIKLEYVIPYCPAGGRSITYRIFFTNGLS